MLEQEWSCDCCVHTVPRVLKAQQNSGAVRGAEAVIDPTDELSMVLIPFLIRFTYMFSDTGQIFAAFLLLGTFIFS